MIWGYPYFWKHPHDEMDLKFASLQSSAFNMQLHVISTHMHFIFNVTWNSLLHKKETRNAWKILETYITNMKLPPRNMKISSHICMWTQRFKNAWWSLLVEPLEVNLRVVKAVFFSHHRTSNLPTRMDSILETQIPSCFHFASLLLGGWTSQHQALWFLIILPSTSDILNPFLWKRDECLTDGPPHSEKCFEAQLKQT